MIKIKDGEIKETISDIVKKIRDHCQPDKIILFGSYAHGQAGEDSDIDLLIIKNSLERRDERDKEIRKLLREAKIPLDIFVYTPQEAERLRQLRGSFINKIFSTGVVLYEQH